MWSFLEPAGTNWLSEQQEPVFLKPERLASYLPGASLFSFPIALRSSNSLTNKHRREERGVEGQTERQRKGAADEDVPHKTTMQPVNMKTVMWKRWAAQSLK